MDRRLVVRAREGDHDAFAEIAASSIGRLTAVARLILHDEYGAQDAVQETLFHAWRDLRSLREPDRLDAWLHRLLVRACYAQARPAWRRARAEVPLLASHAALVPNANRIVESQDQLERGLRHLSTDKRAALVLTYFVDMPLAEAAAALGIPVGTMKSRLNRALAALRAAIEADDRAATRVGEPLA